MRFALAIFDRLATGYVDTVRDSLIPTRLDYLPFAAKLMTLE